MDKLKTISYEKTDRVARIPLNRPERGNGITLDMPAELAACVEAACLDPDVHVLLLAGNGAGFCAGYDLVEFAEQKLVDDEGAEPNDQASSNDSPLDPRVQRANHDPARTWDAMIDYALMSRNVGCFMSLFYAEKPVGRNVQSVCIG